ncbi:threonine-phosphate decarboxylase CobD [Ammoniphilus sp. YIM 78166]|uniref:threonine-phosphate decarboxylase CobD n=1 Tax=Ammoniphilus sp. YIM 78166 TaxID=1644106 RepID=UPI00106F0D14|nr:threonine-phosphate decarboxylase CobD [Ammoniphilus sp. YIM 78166]
MAWIEQFGHGGDLLTASAAFGVSPSELLDFSANINPLGPPEQVISYLHSSLSSIIHYPDPGHRKLKERLAERLGWSTEGILVGNGAAECMALVLQALEPKRVGLIYPCFSEYSQLSAQFGAEVTGILGVAENGFKPDPDELGILINQTDLVFIGHPNNPTGIVYEVEELLEMARQATERGVFLVVDEAFLDFLPPEKQVTLLPTLHQFPKVILIRSMTKLYAIPGLRLGFAIGHPEYISALRRKQVTWSVNSLALAAGGLCLEQREYEDATRRLIQEERSFLSEQVREILGAEVLPGEANFLLVRLPSHWTADDLQWALGAKGIMIRNCSMYQGLTSRDIRLAVRTRAENNRLLAALREVDQQRRSEG